MTDLDNRLPGAARALTFQEPEDSATETRKFTGYQPPQTRELPAEFIDRRQRFIRILSLGLAHPRPGQEEQAYRDDRKVIRDAVWQHSQRIAVASPKGGTGKTPAALILGGILAANRGGSVAVWDACDAAGTLHSRAGGVQKVCISEVAINADWFTNPSAVSQVVATQTSHADVIASLHEREFIGKDILAISQVLDRSYRIHIADTANTPHSGAYQMVLSLSDILVVPTTLTADSVNKALGLLERLQQSDKGQRAIVIVNNFGGPVTAREAHEMFNDAGVGAVLDVPFDPHISAGVEIDTARLSRASKLAWTRVAATVVANLTAKELESE